MQYPYVSKKKEWMGFWVIGGALFLVINAGAWLLCVCVLWLIVYYLRMGKCTYARYRIFVKIQFSFLLLYSCCVYIESLRV